jgi:hypothetical protein
MDSHNINAPRRRITARKCSTGVTPPRKNFAQKDAISALCGQLLQAQACTPIIQRVGRLRQ